MDWGVISEENITAMTSPSVLVLGQGLLRKGVSVTQHCALLYSNVRLWLAVPLLPPQNAHSLSFVLFFNLFHYISFAAFNNMLCVVCESIFKIYDGKIRYGRQPTQN